MFFCFFFGKVHSFILFLSMHLDIDHDHVSRYISKYYVFRKSRRPIV